MKQDLDHLMEERGLDAAVVMGHTYGNPSLAYMLNGADVSQGVVVKRRGEAPLFIHSPIEREEAVATQMTLVNSKKYDLHGIMQEIEDPLEARVEYYRRIFADLDVEGQVGFYGVEDRGYAYVLLKALDAGLPGVSVYGEVERSLFEEARATKDRDEVERIRQAGRLTSEVIQATVDFMRRHPVEDETLVMADGSPLTVGVVKEHILQLLAERRMEDPGGVIFAIGRDAGVPHNKGRADAPIRLGQTIIYDLFPRLAGGYFFDCTRTFCLGYAPPEVAEVHQQVKDCVDAVIAASQVGVETRRLQQITCQFFEELGHPTVGSDRQTDEGYVHSIGHGLGLAIHEEPFFSDVPSNTRTLQPGHVFTVEPGLYYPDRGYGVRIEDVVWIDEDGQAQNLAELSKELVVEMDA
ncbi:MAG: Xaa-Pro peptidase family protein [Anaerolineae bacterium]|jgi:Xaa-Pro aminopeptidase